MCRNLSTIHAMPTRQPRAQAQPRVAPRLGSPDVRPAWWRLAWLGLAATAAFLAPKASHAGDRLLGTWGVSEVEGAGGGGLTPWATITGTGSSNQNGGSAFVTRLKTKDSYDLRVAGAAVGIRDKVAHAFTYAMLMALALKASLTPRAWLAGAGVMAFGLLIEVAQGLGGYRSAELLDAVANLIGILAAGGAARLARRIRGAR